MCFCASVRSVARSIYARRQPTPTLPTRLPTARKPPPRLPAARLPLRTMGAATPPIHSGRTPGTCVLCSSSSSKAKASITAPRGGAPTSATTSPLLAQSAPRAILRKGFATADAALAGGGRNDRLGALRPGRGSASAIRLVGRAAADDAVESADEAAQLHKTLSSAHQRKTETDRPENTIQYWHVVIVPARDGGGSAVAVRLTAAEAAHLKTTRPSAHQPQTETRTQRGTKTTRWRKAFIADPFNQWHALSPRPIGFGSFMVDYAGCVIHPDAKKEANSIFAFEMDHIWPWCKGGRSDRLNLVPLQCRANKRKSDTLILRVDDMRGKSVAEGHFVELVANVRKSLADLGELHTDADVERKLLALTLEDTLVQQLLSTPEAPPAHASDNLRESDVNLHIRALSTN